MKIEIEYDDRQPSSIEAYAKLLIGKTFSQVIEDDRSTDTEDFTNKGDLGQLIERHHFHYKCNNDSRADFPEAGVELKVTPFKENRDGSYSAKERLVLTKINYMDIVNEEFETGHFWSKSRLILLIYYLYKKETLKRFDYEIRYVHLFTPPPEDLVIIHKDYDIIVEKIRAGLAHELSESDTMYLAACTKGAKSTDRTKQPYSDVPAKPRAFSFKTSYMTYVLNNFIIPGKDTYEAVFEADELVGRTFEDALKDKLQQFVGLYEDEIEKRLGIEINRGNKSYEAILACRMLTKVIQKNGKVIIENNLPGISDNGIFHIRPHASKSYYELKTGEIFGSGSISDSDVLPSGERMTKQAYWLNRSYIEGQLDPHLVKKYNKGKEKD